MGNLCNRDPQIVIVQKKKLKRLKSLKDPEIKQSYEKGLGAIINDALQQFKQLYTIKQFQIKAVLGKGGQAQVFLVNLQSSAPNLLRGQYAMKRISKQCLDTERTKNAIMLEKEILSSQTNSFISQILYSFQDQLYLYFIMKVAKGGDMFSYINPQNPKSQMFDKLGENGIRYVVAGCILGLQYLHNHNFIYRDLKAQNILLFNDGYVKLADFGIAQKQTDSTKEDIRGTIVYLAPQVLACQQYDKSIDLWALGVLTYQLAFHCLPFHQSQISPYTFKQLSHERWLKRKWPKKNISQQLKNFINGLLASYPHQRLGYLSFQDLKNHPFFKNFDWRGFESKIIHSPLNNLFQVQQVTKRYTINSQVVADKSTGDAQHNMCSWTYVRKKQSIQDD